MQSISTLAIVFAILLTIWMHVTIVEPKTFANYHIILRGTIQRARPVNILPFKVISNVLPKLNNTSDQFKQRCVANYEILMETVMGAPNPVALMMAIAVPALNNTIIDQFKDYKESAGNDYVGKLDLIRVVDPIGFLVHLHQNSRSEVSLEDIERFYEMSKSTLKYKTVEIGSTSKDITELECYICYNMWEAETKWFDLECGHAFDEDCINKWIITREGKATCPVCRVDI